MFLLLHRQDLILDYLLQVQASSNVQQDKEYIDFHLHSNQEGICHLLQHQFHRLNLKGKQLVL